MKCNLHKFALLLGAMLLSVQAFAANVDFTVDSITYTVTDANSVSVKKIEKKTANLVIPETVTNEADGTTYTVTEVGSMAAYRNDALVTVKLPNTIVEVGNAAFFQCPSLTYVDFGNSLKKILNQAFYECVSLKKIDLPASLETMYAPIADYCYALTAINVDEACQNYISIDGVLFDKNITTLYQCPQAKEGAYEVPSTVTSIEYQGFNSCAKLTSIYFPASVTSIGKNNYLAACFNKCRANITVDPNNEVYSTIDGVLFNKNATKLIYYPWSNGDVYEIPESVDTIGKNAFTYSKLLEVTIPKSVKYIDNRAFNNLGKDDDGIGVASLTVHCLSPEPPKCYDKYIFNSTSCDKLYVPAGSKSAYKIEPWTDFRYIEETVPSGVGSNELASVAVKAVAGGLQVANANGAAVSVYSVDGKQAFTTSAYDGAAISLVPGIYVVKAGNQSLKAVVK